MSQIRSKVPQYGDPKESSWPPLLPSGEKGYYWIDSEGNATQEPPPLKYNLFERAPYVLQDSIEPFYHHGGNMVIESRSQLRDVDRACGTITTDKIIKGDGSYQREQRAKALADKREAHRKALNDLRTFGEGALPEETRQMCKAWNESIKQKGVDLSRIEAKLRSKDGTWK